MAPTRERSLAWMIHGTRLWSATVEALEDSALAAPSLLPKWTGAHVVAHVALNAVALGNLATWARTGVETPMYASAQARDADIDQLALAPAAELRERSAVAARRLERDLAELEPEHWAARVRVRQGTVVPASVIPWLRAREVFLHAIDLGAVATEADLPQGFAHALVGDVTKQRSRVEGHPRLIVREQGSDVSWEVGQPAHPGGANPRERERVRAVVGDVRALAAWVTGRPTALPLATASGEPVPALPPWL